MRLTKYPTDFLLEGSIRIQSRIGRHDLIFSGLEASEVVNHLTEQNRTNVLSELLPTALPNQISNSRDREELDTVLTLQAWDFPFAQVPLRIFQTPPHDLGNLSHGEYERHGKVYADLVVFAEQDSRKPQTLGILRCGIEIAMVLYPLADAHEVALLVHEPGLIGSQAENVADTL